MNTISFDVGGGYYYYNPLLGSLLFSIILLFVFFNVSLVWNWLIIKILNRKKQIKKLESIVVYTGLLFILEIIIYALSRVYIVSFDWTTPTFYIALTASIFSIPIIQICYLYLIDENFLKSFIVAILTNPIWVYLILSVVFQ